MKKVNTKKKSSAKMKLIPAAGSLAISAAMLSTSTFAWFTMSREVEVKNIKMTATVPEDLQISLGKLTTTAKSGNGYSNNAGSLVAAAGQTNANNGHVDAPGDVSEYWASTVDVSKYYFLGKIMPASSTDGQDVFFTPDAAGVGKTLKSGAKFYNAVDNANTVSDNTQAATGKEYTQTYEATLHAITGKGQAAAISDSWIADNPTLYDVTNDAGYYVDIPVWIRSSAKEAVNLAVDAYVTSNGKKDDDDELYLAARAVILNEAKATTSKLLEIKPDNYSSTDTIVNFMTSTNASGEAVASVSNTNDPTYGTVTHYDGDANVCTIAAADADANYGAATKIWVRVWLEGEDPNCWNDNAGQDFNISLKFTKDRLYNAAAIADTSIEKPQGQTANYPTAETFTPKANGDVGSLQNGDTVTVAVTSPNNQYVDMVYTYNDGAWERTFGSYPKDPRYVVKNDAGTVMTDEAAFISYLNSTITTKTLAATGTTMTVAPASGG
jgi:hypothetical protein